jgi:DNA-binding GntR family transcriptional regulator
MQLRDNVGRYHILQDTDLAHAAHSQVRNCIKNGDTDGAALAVATHLEEARDDLLATMSEETPSGHRERGTKPVLGKAGISHGKEDGRPSSA